MKTSSSIDEYYALQHEYKASLISMYSKVANDSESIINHAVDGAIKLLDALSLRELLLKLKPKRILEVGSFLGFSTRWIMESTELLPSTKVTSLDPRVRHRIFDNLKDHVIGFNQKFEKRLTYVDAYLSSANVDMFLHDYINYNPRWHSDDAEIHLNKIPVISSPFDEFDFAFIDGDHSFQVTVDNVRLVASMMPKGGIIIVHDAISCGDVRPALESLNSDEVLTFQGIIGEPFGHWCFQHHLLTRASKSNATRLSLCDGLGVIHVTENVRKTPNSISSLFKSWLR